MQTVQKSWHVRELPNEDITFTPHTVPGEHVPVTDHMAHRMNLNSATHPWDAK